VAIFKIKADVIVSYQYEVEADTIEEAVELLEDGITEDCAEIDSSTPAATEYAVEGVMGWNQWEGGE
jgi:hypothetical protein